MKHFGLGVLSNRNLGKVLRRENAIESHRDLQGVDTLFLCNHRQELKTASVMMAWRRESCFYD
jgi:hypothetical protein